MLSFIVIHTTQATTTNKLLKNNNMRLLIIKQLFRIILQAVGVILSHRLGNTSEKCLPENMPSHFICAYFFEKNSHIKY